MYYFFILTFIFNLFIIIINFNFLTFYFYYDFFISFKVSIYMLFFLWVNIYIININF
jgi:hypothetical protein